MSLCRYVIDFSSAPLEESYEVRQRVDKYSWTGLEFNPDTSIGEFYVEDNRSLDIMEIPPTFPCRRVP